MSSDPLANPFDLAREPERAGLWEMLVARDNEAFVARDWGLCAADFDAERFEGISANGSVDPWKWSLAYPTVDSYRRDWLRMADEYLLRPLADDDHRGLLYRMTRLARFETDGDRMLVWKQFRAEAPLTDGTLWKIAAQSIFRLHRIAGSWKIVGFVGYLPLEARG